MRELFRFFFDHVTDPLTLPIDPLKEWAILGAIGFIAYCIARNAVGGMYRSHTIHGSFLGSLFHWMIRLPVFCALWFVVYWTIVIGQWVIAHWVIVVGTILSLVALYLLCRYMINHRVQSAKKVT